MENISASNNTVFVDTQTKRVHLSTQAYGDGVANVSLYTTSNVVVGDNNGCVIYATGSINCLGSDLSGLTLQAGAVVKSTLTMRCDALTAGSVIPSDGTIPQITEGTQWVSSTFTMTSSSNRIRVTIYGYCGAGDVSCGFPLFEDATANALIVGGAYTASTGATFPAVVIYEAAGYSGAKVFSSRFGGSGGSSTLNKTFGGTSIYGTAKQCSSIKIEEIKQ